MSKAVLQRKHGTAVSMRGVGVLLLGPSGAGKTTLALRLIEQGAVLIADDVVDMTAGSAQITLSAPKTIHGLMELYGVGLVRVPTVQEVRLGLVVQCAQGEIERASERVMWIMEGVAVPEITLHAQHLAAPAIISQLLCAMQSGNWLAEDWSSFDVPKQSLLR